MELPSMPCLYLNGWSPDKKAEYNESHEILETHPRRSDAPAADIMPGI
jgi:hypothetical protein